MASLTIAQVAERLNINPQTARGLVQTGKIRGFKINDGSRRTPWRVDSSDLEIYVEACKEKHSPKAR